MNISMEQAIYDFPDHLAGALDLCRDFSLPKMQAEQMVVLGMGGSAIGGDLVRVIAGNEAPISLHVIRNEEIPKFVDEKTFVVAVSYSGNTQETLSALESASRRTKNVAAVCTGGKLKQMATANKFPCLEIPGGLMPRAALAFTLVPLLHFLKLIYGLSNNAVNLDEAVPLLKTMREKLSGNSAPNKAKTLARFLHGKLPIIFAPTPLFAPAARRFKCQINENAKQPAFFEVFPEADHNTIVGFTYPLPLHRFLAAVLLRDTEETALVQKRIRWTRNAIQDSATEVHEVWSQGKSFLTRLLTLCYQADYVSLYLAEKNNVNPISIEVIDRLKEHMCAG